MAANIVRVSKSFPAGEKKSPWWLVAGSLDTKRDQAERLHKWLATSHQEVQQPRATKSVGGWWLATCGGWWLVAGSYSQPSKISLPETYPRAT